MDMMDILLSQQLNGGGGGGTTVVPNPEGVPTDTLNTIGINNIVYSIGSSGTSYSTTEKPIGTWINNSTLYRMVIEVQEPVTNDNIDLQLNITNLIAAYGMTYNVSTDLFETVYSSDKNHIGIMRGVLSFNTTENRLWKYIIIEYTKSSEPISSVLRNWDFTDSLIDTVVGAPANLGGTSSRSNEGIYMPTALCYINLSNLIGTNRTYEIDFGDCNMYQSSEHVRVFMYNTDEGFIYRSYKGWAVYFGSWEESSITDVNYFANSTLKIEITSNKKWKIYKDNQLVFSPNLTMRDDRASITSIGSPGGQSCFRTTVKAFRASLFN